MACANCATEARRERYLLPQRHARGFGQGDEQRRVEDARRNRHHADALAGEVAGNRQRHADDAALRCRIRRLTDLPVVGRQPTPY